MRTATRRRPLNVLASLALVAGGKVLFGRAFARPTGNPYNVAKAAGSYLGVHPQ